ncbi:MAG: NADH-quinone oxidoreductase subunit I [Melioribacteraceae bacterium]|nr:NADH-quinone oxidoreductase subunit I [Melioribacteraceae bacterium]
MVKNYLKNTWDGLFTILIGMKITWKHLFVPAVTLQYPEERAKLPERTRNRLYVNINDCIGCMQCVTACPVNCIDIETIKGTPIDPPGETSNGKKKALWVTKFEIDTAKCCFCQLCVFPCPTECIVMTDVYEYSEWDRDNLIYAYSNLTVEDIKEKQLNFDKFQAEKEAKKIAMAKAKAEAAAKKKAEEETKSEEKSSDDEKKE